jgi:predicted dehydrogenase
LIGVGAVPQTAHLPILSKMRGARLVALCDNDGAKARAIADRFGAPDVYTDIDDLLELEQLDAVVIATPNHLHEPHVLAALKAGVHVLCGRPLALTGRGVERILSAAEKAERYVQVDNHNRFRADTQALDRFLHGGELGKLTGVRAGSYMVKRNLSDWRHRRAEAGGGAFMELGYPLLDLALWFADFPEPVRVSAQMERGRGAGTVEDSMLVHLECAAGISFSFDVVWNYVGEEDRFWFEILASRGSGFDIRSAHARARGPSGGGQPRLPAQSHRPVPRLARGDLRQGDQARLRRGRCGGHTRGHRSRRVRPGQAARAQYRPQPALTTVH